MALTTEQIKFMEKAKKSGLTVEGMNNAMERELARDKAREKRNNKSKKGK